MKLYAICCVEPHEDKFPERIFTSLNKAKEYLENSIYSNSGGWYGIIEMSIKPSTGNIYIKQIHYE